MKKNENIRAIAVLLICLLVFACNKERIKNEDPKQPSYENELPPVTSSGAHTIGFMLNGNVFTPKGSYNSRANLKFNANPETGMFRIEVLRIENDVLYEFRLVSDKLKAVGTYPISIETSERIYFSRHTIMPDGSLKFNCLTQNFISFLYDAKGLLKITRYDPQNKIYSGTFEVTFTNPDCQLGNQIKITQGRFDVKGGF